MKKLIISIITSMALISASQGASNYAFTYQAKLCDDQGEPIKSGGVVQKNQTITLRLWNAASGGVLQWGKKYNVLTDETGLFNLEVSDETGSAVDAAEGAVCASLDEVFVKNASGALFIGVQVLGSDAEIVPRQRIFAVPFASVANDVRNISSDIAVSGKMSLGAITMSKDGITQPSGTSQLADLKVAGTLDVTGQTTVRGGLSVTGGSISFSSDVNLASGKYVKYDGTAVIPVPVGGIILWTKSSLPDSTHWAICNGANGTPDLRDRFVVAAGGKYSIGNTGGADSVTLTTSQMPGHRHSYVGDDQLEGIETTWDCSTSRGRTDKGYDASSGLSGGSKVYYTDSQGGGSAHENRPPYYALYYIMRIK